jgi:hypothetical protein
MNMVHVALALEQHIDSQHELSAVQQLGRVVLVHD